MEAAFSRGLLALVEYYDCSQDLSHILKNVDGEILITPLDHCCLDLPSVHKMNIFYLLNCISQAPTSQVKNQVWYYLKGINRITTNKYPDKIRLSVKPARILDFCLSDRLWSIIDFLNSVLGWVLLVLCVSYFSVHIISYQFSHLLYF